MGTVEPHRKDGALRMNLKGKRVVITRSADQAQQTLEMVKAAGGIPILFPTIEIVPPRDWRPVDEAIDRLSTYHWVIFTSVNGVRFFTGRMREVKAPLSLLKKRRICAIGPATAEALEDLGLKVSLLPGKFVAESVLEAMKKHGELKGLGVLLPRAEVARNTLPDGLKEAGAQVDVVSVYRTVTANPSKELKEAVSDADVLTFTSPSTLVNFIKIMGGTPQSLAEGKLVACIGPVTEAKARELGMPVHVVAKEYTVAGLLRAIEGA